MVDGCWLGGGIDPETGERIDTPFRIDSDHLCTHGIIVGMTGSGKTGLGIGLLEELVLAGVPIIAVDPKGDLSNLGLVFPEMKGADFAPWVDQAEAKREGIEVDAHAAQVAETWSKGLAGWGIGTERLNALSNALKLHVYTPGAETGIPVDLLGRLDRPSAAVMNDPAASRDLLVGTVTAMLGLVGVSADPVRSPEHVVLSHIVEGAWSSGEALTLETLIMRLVDPPFSKVGVFPLDTFFPPDDRMALAMRLNGLVASPAFAPWTKGAPLDVDAMLDTSGDGVPVNIFHLAHLDDEQRMFFVSMLLERVLAWSRTQSGTSSLRAVLYFDEVFGYLPPHPKNPASKRPLLTLMKQARAMGLGVVLSTQNPVDLDYKAFSNAGLWMVGRLQTRQDRDRVADGLMSAQGDMDRAKLDRWFDRLSQRVFLCQDVRADGPALFNTRWTMSYLRGPLTGPELSRLGADVVAVPTVETATTVENVSSVAPAPAVVAAPAKETEDLTPVAPPAPTKTHVHFLDPRVAFADRMGGVFEAFEEPHRSDGRVVLRPALYAELTLTFDEARGGYLAEETHHRVFFPLRESGLQAPMNAPFDEGDVLKTAPEGSLFSALPDHLDENTEFSAAKREFLEDVYRAESRGQWVNAPLKLHGRADESREEFDARVAAAVTDRADAKVAKLRDRYERDVDRLEERIARKRDRIDELEVSASGREHEELINAGELVLSFFVGRRRSLGSIASKHRQTASAERRLQSATGEVAELEDRLADLVLSLEDDVAEIRSVEAKLARKTESREVRLERADIQLKTFGILWVPVTRRSPPA
jgi:hypothetical protein